MELSHHASQFWRPKFSIVIVNYNQKELLEECIESICDSNYDLSKVQVIVVDNASTDSSRDYLASLNKPNIIIDTIINEKNLLYTGGNNVGIKASLGEYIIILNNDTVVDIEWLNQIEEAMKDSGIGIGQCKILRYGVNQVLDTCIPKIGWFYRCHCLGEGEDDKGQYDNESIDYACGAAMVLRKSMILQIGMFDDDFGMHCEDLDLSLRAKDRGWKVVLIPKAKVWHHKAASMSKLPKWKINLYILKNRILLLWKRIAIWLNRL